jgi:hypothetical protein
MGKYSLTVWTISIWHGQLLKSSLKVLNFIEGSNLNSVFLCGWMHQLEPWEQNMASLQQFQTAHLGLAEDSPLLAAVVAELKPLFTTSGRAAHLAAQEEPGHQDKDSVESY